MSSQSNIQCPKCKRVSYSRGDIENKYCAKCGYHDADSSTPPGVPGKSAKWRQPTPSMQVEALLSCLEGTFYCWKEGIGSPGKLQEVLERHIDDMKELVPHLRAAQWKKE